MFIYVIKRFSTPQPSISRSFGVFSSRRLKKPILYPVASKSEDASPYLTRSTGSSPKYWSFTACLQLNINEMFPREIILHRQNISQNYSFHRSSLLKISSLTRHNTPAHSDCLAHTQASSRSPSPIHQSRGKYPDCSRLFLLQPRTRSSRPAAASFPGTHFLLGSERRPSQPSFNYKTKLEI